MGWDMGWSSSGPSMGEWIGRLLTSLLSVLSYYRCDMTADVGHLCHAFV